MRVGYLKLGDVGKTVIATKGNSRLHGVLSEIRVEPDGTGLTCDGYTDYNFTVTVGEFEIENAHWWEFDFSE